MFFEKNLTELIMKLRSLNALGTLKIFHFVYRSAYTWGTCNDNADDDDNNNNNNNSNNNNCRERAFWAQPESFIRSYTPKVTTVT